MAWNGWTQSWLSIMGLLCWHAPLRTTTHIFLNKQAYCSSNKVIYGEKSAKRPGLTGGSQRGIILSWVERESHIFKSKDHFSSGSPNFYGPISLPFLCGFRKEGSSVLSQIEKGNLVTLKPIKPFLNIRVVFSAFFPNIRISDQTRIFPLLISPLCSEKKSKGECYKKSLI